MVLIEENSFGQDELDGLCYGLAHAHQIIIYGAHEMAECGKRLWCTYRSVSHANKPTEQLCQRFFNPLVKLATASPLVHAAGPADGGNDALSGGRGCKPFCASKYLV